MRTAALLLVVCLLNACAMPHVVTKHSQPKNTKIRVAVLPFKDAYGHPGSGEAATEAMTTRLLSIPAYDIIERSALDNVIKEQAFASSGAIDPKTASELGKLLGVDSIVVGVVTEWQERHQLIFPPAKATVSARMVNARTGAVEWSGDYSLGWQPIKWLAFFPPIWPLGAYFVITSPSVEDRVQKASKGIARVVSKKTF